MERQRVGVRVVSDGGVIVAAVLLYQLIFADAIYVFVRIVRDNQRVLLIVVSVFIAVKRSANDELILPDFRRDAVNLAVGIELYVHVLRDAFRKFAVQKRKLHLVLGVHAVGLQERGVVDEPDGVKIVTGASVSVTICGSPAAPVSFTVILPPLSDVMTR